MNRGSLTFFCGKMGSGKTTKSLDIARDTNAVLLSEDEWLLSIYPGKIKTLEDYIKYSNRLKPQIKKLVQAILITGTDVVMDFPANTISQRKWFREIFSEIEAPHSLIYINIPSEICKERIKKRGLDQPERSATDTTEMFEQVTKYFSEPAFEEGFSLTTVSEYA